MKQQFTTRIDKDILDEVKVIAERERRTVNNTVEYLLAKAVDAYKSENKPNQAEQH